MAEIRRYRERRGGRQVLWTTLTLTIPFPLGQETLEYLTLSFLLVQ